MNNFGRKLNWLKGTFRVTDGEIGAASHESASLVCRWRSGERSLDRYKGEYPLTCMAEFFAKRAVQVGNTHLLANVLSVDEGNIVRKDGIFRSAFIDFLYDANPPPGADRIDITDNDALSKQTCFLGVDGILAALSLLKERLQGVPAAITAYLSLEHSRILRDSSAVKLWETLWTLSGGNPIRLVFDKWADANEAMKTLRELLPFMQNGRLQLHLIKSTQKFFYSNMTLYADDVGMVVIAEPVGGLGNNVSMFVESPEYIKGMGSVFARFDKNSKPIEKHLNMAATKDEAVCFSRLFEPDGDIKTAIDGASLLYMDAEAYLRLLKLSGIAGSQRAYRLDRFIKDKLQFEAFLEDCSFTEIYSLPTLDRMIASMMIKTPDFSFCSGVVKADGEILKSIFTGMMDYLERYNSLSIYLTRSGLPHPDFSCRLKDDRFALLHSYKDGVPHAVWSDTWLLVYEYIRQYEEALLDGDLITTKDAVLSALKIRQRKAITDPAT